jgi:hypothetical protein
MDDHQNDNAQPVEREEQDHSHNGDHDDCAKCEKPSGSSQYGWVWVVGIILIVAVALYFLQINVPETVVEESVTEEPTEVLAQDSGVYNVSVPNSVPAGAIFSVDWDVSDLEETSISHTAIHWGTESKTSYAKYPETTQEHYNGSFEIPSDFETNIKVPDGAEAIYLRAHATIGDEQFESDEIMVEVK